MILRGFQAFRRLTDAQQGHDILQRLWLTLKPYLLDGHVFELVVRPETRTAEQNAKFHALCEDIARSGLQWCGKERSPAEWKVLLVSAHATATKEESEVVTGLEGELVNLRESTAQMSKRRCSSLIEYTLSFCAQNDIEVQQESK